MLQSPFHSFPAVERVVVATAVAGVASEGKGPLVGQFYLSGSQSRRPA